MKIKRIAEFFAAVLMCMTCTAGQNIQLIAAEPEKGDVSGDGSFGVTDIILLQKWLHAVPDTHLADWQKADFNEDGILNIFDFCLMKRELLKLTESGENMTNQGKVYQRIGLIDQQIGAVAFEGIIPEGWTAETHGNWGLINPMPGQEITVFTSPDGKASVQIASEQTYEQASDRGYGADLSDFITFAPYMNASSYIDYLIQNNFSNAEFLRDMEIPTAHQQAIDNYTQQFYSGGINTARAYSRYVITPMGAEGTVARRQYRIGNGYAEYGCAVSAYQYGYTKVFLNITETWWNVVNTVSFTATDREAFDKYYSDYEMIVANGYFTGAFYSANAYVIKQIMNMVINYRTEQAIAEAAGSYSSSGTQITSSDMDTQDKVMQAWDDYIKDEDRYTTTDGNTVITSMFNETVAQDGNNFYVGSRTGIPYGYTELIRQ